MASDFENFLNERLRTCTFLDIFNLQDIQKLQDDAAQAMQIACLITSPEGEPITWPSNFTDFCANLVRKSPEGQKHCFLSDKLLGSPSPDGPRIAVCHSGKLLDAGVSFIVGGKHIGNWLMGQVLSSKLLERKEEEYRQTAVELGINPDTYVQALKKVPVISEKRFQSIAEFVARIASQLSEMGYRSFRQKAELEFRQKVEETINQDYAKMKMQIQKDPMTHLLNKVAIQSSVENYLKLSDAGETDALLIVDIDKFKQVNDTLGHIFGDTVIQDIATTLSAVFRNTDFIGRIGGDEFLVFMKNASENVVKKKAVQLCQACRNTYTDKGKEARTSVSIGIAFSDPESRTFATLFSKADIALYRAKEKGRDQCAVYRKEYSGTPGRTESDRP